MKIYIKLVPNWLSTWFLCPHYSNCQNRVSPLTHIFYTVQTKYPPLYRNNSIGQNSNFEKPHRLTLTIWKAKPHWLSWFKSADSKLTINEHLGVLPTGTSYWVNYVLKCQNLGFHSETPSCKTPTNLTVDGCSAQAQAFECLSSTHKLCCFP